MRGPAPPPPPVHTDDRRTAQRAGPEVSHGLPPASAPATAAAQPTATAAVGCSVGQRRSSPPRQQQWRAAPSPGIPAEPGGARTGGAPTLAGDRRLPPGPAMDQGRSAPHLDRRAAASAVLHGRGHTHRRAAPPLARAPGGVPGLGCDPAGLPAHPRQPSFPGPQGNRRMATHRRPPAAKPQLRTLPLPVRDPPGPQPPRRQG